MIINRNCLHLATGCGLLMLVIAFSSCRQSPEVRVLSLTDGIPFHMGKVDARRIVHPDMGARNITLNYAVSQPGHEFPQHVHDDSDDTFLVLEGEVDVRQDTLRQPLMAGQAAFVPSGEIHGTITTGSNTAVLISFQCPPDFALYDGSRDSERRDVGPLKGVVTPGSVKLVDFADDNGFFVHPGMGSDCISVAHRRLQPGQRFSTLVEDNDEEILFVWKGAISVSSDQQQLLIGEKETLFVSGGFQLDVVNESSVEAIVIQAKASN